MAMRRLMKSNRARGGYKGFPFSMAIEPPREKVINHATLGKALHPSMAFAFVELAPEGCGCVCPNVRRGEREELAGGEVTGVGGDNVEKAGFHFGVTEGF